MELALIGGGDTIWLHGGNHVLGCTWFPRTPSMLAVGAGEERQGLAETCEVSLSGAGAEVRALAQRMERVLSLAAAASTMRPQMPPGVLLRYRPHRSAEWVESRIRSGRLVWSEEPDERRLRDVKSYAQVNLIWERDPYWEGGEVELALQSNLTGRRTGGVDIDNGSGWVRMEDTEVRGSLPSPLRLSVQNLSGASIFMRRIHLANRVFGSMNAKIHWAGTEAQQGRSITWTGAIDHLAANFHFELDSNQLRRLAGRRYRMLAAFPSISSGAWVQARVATAATPSIPIDAQEEVEARTELLDLGALYIPPALAPVQVRAVALQLSIRASGAGFATLDSLHLLAADNTRTIEQIGYRMNHGARLVDDGIDGGVYYESGGGRDLIARPVSGAPLRVWPDREQRMVAIFDEATGYVPGRRMRIRAWYRPRYQTV